MASYVKPRCPSGPIGAAVPFDVAALVGCAVATGTGAVWRTAGVRPGDRVAVFGCGGVGMSALHTRQRPAPGGFIEQRASQVLGETIDLLDRIVHDSDPAGDPPLLAAIADGIFGLMKRPPDKGRGLEGVARKARDYYNPATDLLEEN